mgnify:CR=1 FL=1|tara:strand:- start:42 stop:305 length:264 start_codon:yes stop_codon:yes gene_type:complete
MTKEKTKDLKYNQEYVLLNVAAQGYIKKINDDLFDFYNQPYMAFIPAKRRAQFKSIMTKLVELEPSSKDLKELEQPKKPQQLEFNFS